MSHLFDTQILLWAVYDQKRLSARARRILSDPTVETYFSAVSVLEVAIKTVRGRPDFQVDAAEFAVFLRQASFVEIDVTSAHASKFAGVPVLYKDPFDRLLIAQAMAEDLVLVTADKTMARYPGKILRV